MSALRSMYLVVVCLILPITLTLGLEQYQPYLSPPSGASTHPGGPGPNSAASRLSLLQYILAAKNNQGASEQDAILDPEDEDEDEQDPRMINAMNSVRMNPGGAGELSMPGKRFSDFAMPYIKYKRNNGIWIWMPAQGYVSVPKDQQALDSADAAKQGKIMRYGRK